MRVQKLFGLLAAALLVAVVTAQVSAQQDQGRRRGQDGQQGQGFRGGPGGRGGFGGPGGFGGGGIVGLLGIEQVQKEIELLDEQKADIQKLQESLRGERGQFNREEFQNLSEDERRARFETLRAEGEKLAKEAQAKLAEILLPHQLERVKQISVQMLGARALLNDEVVATLGISDDQKAQIQEVIDGSRERMRDLFTPGERPDPAKFAEFRTNLEKDVLAKLTDAQREKFTTLKGEPFEMPQGAFGFGGPGGRGPGGPGGRGPGGQGGRPQRPDAE